jgi:hypothetical protein
LIDFLKKLYLVWTNRFSLICMKVLRCFFWWSRVCVKLCWRSVFC